MKKVRVWKRQLANFFRKYEKAILLLAICLSAIAPLIKYSLSRQGYHALDGNRKIEELRAGETPVSAGATREGDSNGMGQQEGESGSTLKQLETPLVCTIAEHELAKWQACNKRKWKKIPSCKRGVSKCLLLPLFKQKNTPFCVDCLEPWRKMDDCFSEAETYFLTQRRCVKVWQSVKSEMCAERSSAISADVLARVSRECMLTNSMISKASVEVSKFKRIVPGAFEEVQRQERQQRRGRGSGRGRRSRRRDSTTKGSATHTQQHQLEGEGKEEKEEEWNTDNMEINPKDPIEIKVTPQYPSLDIN